MSEPVVSASFVFATGEPVKIKKQQIDKTAKLLDKWAAEVPEEGDGDMRQLMARKRKLQIDCQAMLGPRPSKKRTKPSDNEDDIEWSDCDEAELSRNISLLEESIHQKVPSPPGSSSLTRSVQNQERSSDLIVSPNNSVKDYKLKEMQSTSTPGSSCTGASTVSASFVFATGEPVKIKKQQIDKTAKLLDKWAAEVPEEGDGDMRQLMARKRKLQIDCQAMLGPRPSKKKTKSSDNEDDIEWSDCDEAELSRNISLLEESIHQKVPSPPSSSSVTKPVQCQQRSSDPIVLPDSSVKDYKMKEMQSTSTSDTSHTGASKLTAHYVVEETLRRAFLE